MIRNPTPEHPWLPGEVNCALFSSLERRETGMITAGSKQPLAEKDRKDGQGQGADMIYVKVVIRLEFNVSC